MVQEHGYRECGMLNPSRGLGTFECVNTGRFKDCCPFLDEMHIQCRVVRNVAECVWTPLETFHVNVTAHGNTVRVHCHPYMDVHPDLEFIMALVCLVFACYVQDTLHQRGIYMW